MAHASFLSALAHDDSSVSDCENRDGSHQTRVIQLEIMGRTDSCRSAS
jgi:hypothetical protein